MPSASLPQPPTGTGITPVSGSTANSWGPRSPDPGAVLFQFLRSTVRKTAGGIRIDVQSGVRAAGVIIMGDPSNQAKSIFLTAIEEHAPEQWPAFRAPACDRDVRL